MDANKRGVKNRRSAAGENRRPERGGAEPAKQPGHIEGRVRELCLRPREIRSSEA